MTESATDGAPTHPVIHLSQLLKRPVIARNGDIVGALDDLIVRLLGVDTYPTVSGLVVNVGGRRVYVSVERIEHLDGDRVMLAQNKVDLRGFERREGEVLLRSDVLGHRLIDVPAAELVHAYDIELENPGHGWVLARLDTRRPARFFGLIKSHGGHASRDWKAFEPLIGHKHSMVVRRVGGRVGTLKPAQIADLLFGSSDRRDLAPSRVTPGDEGGFIYAGVAAGNFFTRCATRDASHLRPSPRR